MTRDESADWVAMTKGKPTGRFAMTKRESAGRFAMTKGEVFVLNRDDEWGHLILDFDDLPDSSTENDEYSVDYG